MEKINWNVRSMSGAESRGTIVVLASPKVLGNSRTRMDYCRSSYGSLVLRHTYKVSKRIFLRIWIFWNQMTSAFSKNIFAGSLTGSEPKIQWQFLSQSNIFSYYPLPCKGRKKTQLLILRNISMNFKSVQRYMAAVKQKGLLMKCSTELLNILSSTWKYKRVFYF